MKIPFHRPNLPDNLESIFPESLLSGWLTTGSQVLRFEQELNSSDLVYNYYVDSITNNETIYKIIYNSTPKKFIKNFKDRNFQIDYTKEIWSIK